MKITSLHKTTLFIFKQLFFFEPWKMNPESGSLTKQTEHMLQKGNFPLHLSPHALDLTWANQCQKPFGLHN